MKLAAIDIFSYVVEYSPSMVREFIIKEGSKQDDVSINTHTKYKNAVVFRSCSWKVAYLLVYIYLYSQFHFELLCNCGIFISRRTY